MNNDVYYYPNSNVLKNKFGIKSNDELEAVESFLVGAAYTNALKNPIKGKFDFDHLKTIHATLFGKVYDWAGKTRTIDIHKGNKFCASQNINGFAEDVFKKLKADNLLIGLNKFDFVSKFTQYFSDLNALHPFREGNGRATRLFMFYLADQAGYRVAFNQMNKNDFIDACKTALATDNDDLLKNIFSEIIEEKDKVQSLNSWINDVKNSKQSSMANKTAISHDKSNERDK